MSESMYTMILEAMDQMVQPVSTNEIYMRMVKLGYLPGTNVAKERSSVSARLAELRGRNKVMSEKEQETGLLLWSDISDTSRKHAQPDPYTEMQQEIMNLSSDMIRMSWSLLEIKKKIDNMRH